MRKPLGIFGHFGFTLRRRAGIALALAALATSFAFVRAPLAPADIANRVDYLGRLPLPAQWSGIDAPSILAMDSPRKRILSVYYNKKSQTDHMLVYDLHGKGIPSIARDADMGSGYVRNLPSPYLNVVDGKRDRLLSLVAHSAVGSQVEVFDLKTMKQSATWTLDEKVPGYLGWGITYSEKDDLVYVVGEIIGVYVAQNGYLFSNSTKPPVSAIVMALRPEDGTMVWALPLPNCQPLNTISVGALIARSEKYSALYVPCARNFVYPNLAGLTRITIKQGSNQTEALSFPQEFFPISGVWTQGGPIKGIAAFDPVTDRVLMQSLSSTTPGAWVFDGFISGWVGFVPSPGLYDDVGVNVRSGHFYATTLGSPMLVSSIRGTPVPQGAVFQNVKAGAEKVFVYTDAGSGRFFLSLPTKIKGGDGEVLTYGVFNDNTTDETPLDPTDYDQLTSDLPETEADATFAGGVRGFGARLAAVGGFGGIWEGIRTLTSGATGTWPLSGVSPGDRAVAFANVPALDLRNAGAGAGAQAVAPDTNTDDEVRTHQTQVAGLCHEIARMIETQGQRDLAAAIVSTCIATPASNAAKAPGKNQSLADACVSVQKALLDQKEADLAAAAVDLCESAGVDGALLKVSQNGAWPWAPVACLDGGGDRIEQKTSAAGAQGEAHAVCDLAGTTATSGSTGPGITVNVSGGSLKIASSSAEASAIRTTAGIVTKITSISYGLEIVVPNVGSLSIGKVTATGIGKAHGTPGSADVTLERTFERLVVRDAKGKIVRSIAECDVESERCQSALATANTLIAPRLRLYVPAASLRETPKGAFAGAQKADAEYLNALNTQNDNSRVVPALELIFYNDTAEKSRLVAQFAGVQVNSIYYLQANGSEVGGVTIVREEVPVPVDRFVPGPPQPPQVFTRIIQRPTGVPARLSGALAVMARSPKEALHLAMIWILFGAAVAAAFRRRALRRSMES